MNRPLSTLLLALLAGCASAPSGLDHVRQQLPILGHRNWIAVVDMAYPAQIAPGVETIYVGGDQLDAVRAVRDMIAAAPHVRAKVRVDSELDLVPEADAPGISAYRDRLAPILSGGAVERIPHEAIIARLDEAARTFRVLLVKTDLVLPYTSVFFELDCGYWSGAAEERLRGAAR